LSRHTFYKKNFKKLIIAETLRFSVKTSAIFNEKFFVSEEQFHTAKTQFDISVDQLA